MAIILALPRLFDAVEAQFLLDGTSVPNLFGWRTPELKDVVGNRIAWVPGDPQGNLASGIAGAKQQPNAPKSLGTLQELFHVVISAFDTTAPESERAQYQALRELLDAWWRAVFLAAHGTVRVVSTKYLIDKKVRRAGASLLVVCNIDAMLPDEGYVIAPVDTRAVLDVEKLNTTETISVPED